MPNITFTIGGEPVWKGAVIEDGHNMIETFDIPGASFTHGVPSDSLAWFTLYAKGPEGKEVTVEIKRGEFSLVRKRTYLFGSDLTVAKSIQFDPDKPEPTNSGAAT
ncbi:MAG: hypothetical protein ABL928_06205 [Sphingorhabdus sp.]